VDATFRLFSPPSSTHTPRLRHPDTPSDELEQKNKVFSTIYYFVKGLERWPGGNDDGAARLTVMMTVALNEVRRKKKFFSK
jgi:hypothetical protein